MKAVTLEFVKSSIEKIARQEGFEDVEFYDTGDSPFKYGLSYTTSPTHLRIPENEVYRFKVMVGYSVEILKKGIRTLILHEKAHHIVEVDKSRLSDLDYREVHESQTNLAAAEMWTGGPLEFVAIRLLSQGRHPKFDGPYIKSRYNWLSDEEIEKVSEIIDGLSP